MAMNKARTIKGNHEGYDYAVTSLVGYVHRNGRELINITFPKPVIPLQSQVLMVKKMVDVVNKFYPTSIFDDPDEEWDDFPY